METSSADAERSKPEPDIFEAALERLGGNIRRGQVIVVGDSPHDAEAAVKAGLRIIGVLCGGFPESALREAGCMAIYGGPEDLLAPLRRIPARPSQPVLNSAPSSVYSAAVLPAEPSDFFDIACAEIHDRRP